MHRYFDLDQYSTANTIIGHDNTYLPPITHDPEWSYLTAGKLQLGDFSTADSVRLPVTQEVCIQTRKADCSFATE